MCSGRQRAAKSGDEGALIFYFVSELVILSNMQVNKTAATVLLTLAGIVIIRDGLVAFATTGLSPMNAGESVAGFLLLCGVLVLCLKESGDLNTAFRIGIVTVIGGWFILLGVYGYLENPGALETFFIIAGIVVLVLAGMKAYREIRPAAAGS